MHARSCMGLALAAWSLGFCAPLGASPSSHADVLQAAKAQEAAVIRSLEEMVLIESGSDDARGLARMQDYLEGRLRNAGASPERIAMQPGNTQLVKGTLKGTGTLRVLLIAHMDTVYAAGILKTEPYRREGNQLFGPGIADDKGGIAVILHTLAVLRRIGWQDYAQITVLFNPDEEIGSAGSGDAIAHLGEQHDVVLSFEPTAAKAIAKHEGVLLNAAGTAQVHMQVTGVAAHAGAAAEQGRNALLELAYQLDRTADIAKDMPDVQLNWTTASAGEKRNQIPAQAQAGGDVRVMSDAARDRLLRALQAKVAQSSRVPETTTQVRIDPGRPPFVAGPAGERLAAIATNIYAELDGRRLITLPATFGGTDAGFAARSGKPAVLESMGLAGWGYHARNEYIEIDSIVPRLYLAARLLQVLACERADPVRC